MSQKREKSTPPTDAAILAQAIFVVVLAVLLVGAMRWAVSVTNANTRRISANVSGLQNQFDRDAETLASPRPAPTEESGKPDKSK